MDKTAITKYNLRPIILLLLLTVFLIVSTYAWFSSNKKVRVNTLDIVVQASEGFQISLDGLNWKSVIQSNEITGDIVNQTYPANKNQVPNEMLPVSTATFTDGSTGYMNMFLGTVVADESSSSATYGQYIITSKQITEQKGNTGCYIAFDLFLKTNYDIYLYLQEEADVSDNAITGTNRANKGMENSARVAFVEQGYIPATDTRTESALAAAAQALKYTDYQDGRNVTIWEPNYDAHTEFAKAEVFGLLGIATNSAIWNSRILYDGLCTPIPTSSPILLGNANETSSPAYFKSIPDSKFVRTPKGGSTSGSTDTGIIVKGGITKMRIYMWLEGQDLDCGDSASGSDIRFDLSLEAVRVP